LDKQSANIVSEVTRIFRTLLNGDSLTLIRAISPREIARESPEGEGLPQPKGHHLTGQ
jgi:hypothetical protein